MSGIGAKRELLLNKIGINNIDELAKVKHYILKEKLERYGTQHGDISKKIILQSQSQSKNKAIKLNSEIALNNFKKAKGLLIYDIESDPFTKQYI